MPADRLIHARAGIGRKVAALSDLAFRVWITYLWSADDFGILPMTLAAFQGRNVNLENRPGKPILEAMRALVDVGLVRTFEHQGRLFLFQPNWQDWQKVRWPAKTINPRPPLESMTPDTVALFSVFPGGSKVPLKNQRSNSVDLPEEPGSTSEVLPPTRETANGLRLTANGSDREKALTPIAGLDGEWAQLVSAYPEQGRVASFMAQSLFFAARQGGVTLAEMLEAIENHKVSERWAVARKIPNLQTWLEGKRWQTRLDPPMASSPGPSKADRALAKFRAGGR